MASAISHCLSSERPYSALPVFFEHISPLKPPLEPVERAVGLDAELSTMWWTRKAAMILNQWNIQNPPSLVLLFNAPRVRLERSLVRHLFLASTLRQRALVLWVCLRAGAEWWSRWGGIPAVCRCLPGGSPCYPSVLPIPVHGRPSRQLPPIFGSLPEIRSDLRGSRVRYSWCR